MKRIINVIVVLIAFTIEGNSQSFKFNHILKQDDIQGANFELHQKISQQLHPIIPLSSITEHELTKGLEEQIVTSVGVIIMSDKRIKIRLSPRFSSSTVLTAGMPYAFLVDDTEYLVPAHTPLTIPIPANTIYITSDEQNAKVTIKPIGIAPFGAKDFIRPLESKLVRLVAPTKGIVYLSGGKIMFDPWQITNFATAPAGIVDIDKNTTVPLELVDGRNTISDRTKVLNVPYRHYTLGLNSIPFRYRGQKIVADTVHTTGTVTTAFSLALSVGHTWGRSLITTRARNDYSFTIGAFIGPSSVELKKENVLHPLEFKSGRTNPVLSYGLNTIFARNGFGFLFAAGFDKAFGKYGNDWIYNNDLWFGLGISTSFAR